MTADLLAIALDRAARELQAAGEAAAEPFHAAGREAAALAQALRCCPKGGEVLPALLGDLRIRLETAAKAGGRPGARVAQALEALRELGEASS